MQLKKKYGPNLTTTFICMVCGYLFRYYEKAREYDHICLYCRTDGTLLKAAERGFYQRYKGVPIGYSKAWEHIIPKHERGILPVHYVDAP